MMGGVATLKAEHPIALVHCFAIALAATDRVPLLTGDPEIINRAKGLPCEVMDLRRTRRKPALGPPPALTLCGITAPLVAIESAQRS